MSEPSTTETAPAPQPVEKISEAEPVAPPAPTPDVVEGPEPENKLTSSFTDEEWKALKEFRTQLPQIFTEAYNPEKPDTKAAPITIWGVTIDPYAPNKDARVSVILMKFLRARNLNVKEAHTMLVATLRWRDEFNVDALMDEKFPEELFGNLGFVSGHDKEGRPVNYNLYGGHIDIKAVFSDVPRFLRWRVQLMENSIELLDFETLDQMVQVHDYDGVSFMSGRDANQKAAAAEASSIFQNHYPEFLARKFFLNVPTVLTWIFWLFKPMISANTLAKMTVVGSGPRTIGAAMLPVVPPDQLPKRYGGEAPDFS